jgi:AAA domain
MDASEQEPEFAPELPKVEPLFTVRTARELCAIPDPDGSDMLLGPLVVRGHRTILVADTGHGKTTLAMQLAGAVLTGAEALGYQGAGLGPVMIVDLEQGIRSIKRVLREAKLAGREDVIYLSVPDGLALDTEDREREELKGIVSEYRPTVLVLDPYYKAHRGDANEERAVVDLMRYLDRLRAEHGFALLLPAHPRKDATSNGARKLTLHDVSGSGAVTRGAELVLALERLSHGYGRLRILKDRDFDLQVGEAWPLIFERGEGYNRDPKERRDAAELERSVIGDKSGDWRTRKDGRASSASVRRERANCSTSWSRPGMSSTRSGPPDDHPRPTATRLLPRRGRSREQ